MPRWCIWIGAFDDTDPEFEDDEDQKCPAESEDERSDDAGSDGDQSNDGGDQSDGDGGDGDGGDDGFANAGWAEAMAKILAKKTPASKSSILVKNKELDKVKEKEKQEQLERKKQFDKKRSWEMLCREKPDIVKDREAEKALQRVATRGVVQLFNAVRKHQKTIDKQVKEAGGSERKKAKLLSSVSKKDFIDVLRRTDGDGRATSKPQEDTAAAEEKPAWSVLRDDFMMGATMKDWDKESDTEEAAKRCGAGE
ncbi:RRP15-like protein isoform X2 [Takifugu rubripes]|uniref:RRP15-like protein isoform X2 n=1 Tax=Takifugu rubripes TaxID=31033 RepID=UPI000E6EAAE7|nr:RRP15-like protein isoform X2 [Takifugu rubripes]